MQIIVHPNKILQYLLVDEDKSRFFRKFGYADHNWELLQSDLIMLARNNPRQLRRTTKFGEEYEIIGKMIAPNGREILIQSGWIIDAGYPDIFRLVTAYPG